MLTDKHIILLLLGCSTQRSSSATFQRAQLSGPAVDNLLYTHPFSVSPNRGFAWMVLLFDLLLFSQGRLSETITAIIAVTCLLRVQYSTVEYSAPSTSFVLYSSTVPASQLANGRHLASTLRNQCRPSFDCTPPAQESAVNSKLSVLYNTADYVVSVSNIVSQDLYCTVLYCIDLYKNSIRKTSDQAIRPCIIPVLSWPCPALQWSFSTSCQRCGSAVCIKIQPWMRIQYIRTVLYILL